MITPLGQIIYQFARMDAFLGGKISPTELERAPLWYDKQQHCLACFFLSMAGRTRSMPTVDDFLLCPSVCALHCCDFPKTALIQQCNGERNL